MGPPKAGQLVEYTRLPDDEWKSPASPDTAFYIANPQDDRKHMIENLNVLYPTGTIPKPEMKVWRDAISTINPKPLKPGDIKRQSHEPDITFLMRAYNRSRGRVLWAYLGHKKYFNIITSDVTKNIPGIVANSARGEFPYHPGMKLKPPMT